MRHWRGSCRLRTMNKFNHKAVPTSVGGLENQTALRKENKHLRETMSDLLIHGQEFVRHQEARVEREHQIKLGQKKGVNTFKTSSNEQITCTILYQTAQLCPICTNQNINLHTHTHTATTIVTVRAFVFFLTSSSSSLPSRKHLCRQNANQSNQLERTLSQRQPHALHSRLHPLQASRRGQLHTI